MTLITKASVLDHPFQKKMSLSWVRNITYKRKISTNSFMKYYYFLSTLVLSIFLSSCAVSGYVKFTPHKDFIFSKEELKNYMSSTDNPKVVLRVPNSSTIISEDQYLLNSTIYNTIEKELLNAGFEVRDRSLFNVVIDKSKEDIDYNTIASKTNTDLIIELVDIKDDIQYFTKTYYTKSDKPKPILGNAVVKYGASVEFRVVSIETNNITGVYTFNYAPCETGCPYSSKAFATKSKDEIMPAQYIEIDLMAEFITMCTQELILDMGR